METSLHRELKRQYAGDDAANRSRARRVSDRRSQPGSADRNPARFAGGHSRQGCRLAGTAPRARGQADRARSCWSSMPRRAGRSAAPESRARSAVRRVRRTGLFHARASPPAIDAGSGAGRHRGGAPSGPRQAAALAQERFRGRRPDVGFGGDGLRLTRAADLVQLLPPTLPESFIGRRRRAIGNPPLRGEADPVLPARNAGPKARWQTRQYADLPHWPAQYRAAATTRPRDEKPSPRHLQRPRVILRAVGAFSRWATWCDAK